MRASGASELELSLVRCFAKIRRCVVVGVVVVTYRQDQSESQRVSCIRITLIRQNTQGNVPEVQTTTVGKYDRKAFHTHIQYTQAYL